MSETSFFSVSIGLVYVKYSLVLVSDIFLFHVHTQPRVSVYIELHFYGNSWDRAAESGGQEP